MNKSSRFLESVNNFLVEHAPEPEAPTELAKPFPDSELHALSVPELQHKLYESRRLQHLLVQFSEEENKHFAFIDEATAIISYKTLDELNKTTLRNYVHKSAGSMNSAGMEQGHTQTMAVAYGDKEGVMQDRAKSAIKTSNKRFAGIMKATRKLSEEAIDEENLEELSTKTLKDYRDAASEKVGAYKFGSKAPNMDIGTVSKRIQGFVKAGGKIKAKNAKSSIPCSEEVSPVIEKHDDEKEDKALIKAMVKKEALKEGYDLVGARNRIKNLLG